MDEIKELLKNFSPEEVKALAAQAATASSAEELLSMAKEKGIALTEEMAGTIFEKINEKPELSVDELENVGGGSFYEDHVYDGPYAYYSSCMESCNIEFIKDWEQQYIAAKNRGDQKRMQECAKMIEKLGTFKGGIAGEL